ncbi:MAG: DEAD/DEAH box helicase [SAR324 cluster bacterium]|nr:DEAD/DEAH box helicase [SAR324 cluster bacterium]
MSTPTPTPVSFESFGLSKPILDGLRDAGFKVPSPIQEKAIPLVLEGRDLIAQAQTGTGKTAAFGLPGMSMMETRGEVSILIITPTRELCSQVSDEMFKLGKFAGIKTVAVYGGQPIGRQQDLVNRGAEVLVATPGRLLDHLKSKRFKKFAPTLVVLDEADEMLDMGFLEDIEAIFKYLPEKRQTVLFSATMPPKIKKLGQKILNNPAEATCTTGQTTSKDIEQRYYVVSEKDRTQAMVRLMETEDPEKTIIFCRTKRETDALATSLISLGFRAKAIHGDLDQKQREIAIKSFKASEIDIMVATDVAARGLDVSDVTHVFNYHLPFDAESYVHRIGRTGRAGKKGIAITLVSPFEYKSILRISDVTGSDISPTNVPTLQEIELVQDDKLIKQLTKQPQKQGAIRIIKAMSGQMELQDLACQALSMLIDKTGFSGPNQIGLDQEQISKLSKSGGGGGGYKGKGGGGGRGGYQGKRRSGGGGGGNSGGGSGGGGYQGKRRSGGGGGGGNSGGGYKGKSGGGSGGGSSAPKRK